LLSIIYIIYSSNKHKNLKQLLDFDENKKYLKLLFIIILLYLTFFKLKSLYSTYLHQGGLLLINQPTYTNHKNTVASYEDLSKDNTIFNKKDYTYGISFWLYIDSESANTYASYNKFTPILSYGNKPSVLYNASINTLMFTMGTNGLTDEELNILKHDKKIKMDDNNNIIVYTKNNILLQKWNNIIINYNGGTLDIFYNSELVKSFSGYIPYMNSDTLVVGEDKGIRGGICNLLYFSKTLDLNKINNLYYSVKDYTPPIYNKYSNETIINI